MLNYHEFIIEKLLLESEVVYSKQFRQILKSINTVVSSQLLSIENKDLEVIPNYIDLSDKNDRATFILDSKAMNMLSNNETDAVVIDEERYFPFNNRNKPMFERMGIEELKNNHDGDSINNGTEVK